MKETGPELGGATDKGWRVPGGLPSVPKAACEHRPWHEGPFPEGATWQPEPAALLGAEGVAMEGVVTEGVATEGVAAEEPWKPRPASGRPGEAASPPRALPNRSPGPRARSQGDQKPLPRENDMMGYLKILERRRIKCYTKFRSQKKEKIFN